MISIKFNPPGRILQQIGERAKAMRLVQNLSRESVCTRSGVPLSTLKRFETTGQIGTAQLIAIAIALDAVEDIGNLFVAKPIKSIDQLAQSKRQRGTK
ncbi:helix-turn-helix domain-containing protein [Solimicrobium silvestre]|nr:helix-turn-helix transcriptional regulator [Solimicrobium silvestre]